MAASTTPRSTGLSSTTISPALLFSTIKGDAVGRLKRVFLRTENCVILVLSLIPVASAQENTVLFTPVPTADAMTIADVDAESGQLYMSAWDRRGELIRSGLTARECVGNLSVALHALGSLNAAEYNGAAGALSLLPTAGALIGSPTRELWVVFKLMPLAGVLSMCLSLGGTMVPSTAGEYNPNTAFSYGGMIATTELAEKRIGQDLEEGGLEKLSTAERFANRVARRADEVCGGGLYGRVWLGVAIQVVLVATIMIALWYGQLGGIITWWCQVSFLHRWQSGYSADRRCRGQVWGWMYFWFSLVIITSLIDNIASVPFTDSWTMRISKAPTTISISEEAPLVQGQAGKDVLEAITAGFNSRSRVTIAASEPYTSQRTCFYVVVSKEGVSPSHALIRIFSKAGSVAVFAFGTTLFASATPMSVSITLMVLSLVLSSGVFGRVVAMWIAAEMNRYNEPVLHAVVQTRADAADHVQWLLALPGLVIEMHGHVICNGRSVHRRNEWLSRSKYIGLLAPPFDITKLASRVQPLNSVRSSSPSDGSQKASSFEQSLVSHGTA